MKKHYLAIVTPVLIETEAQQKAFDDQQYFLNNVEVPDDFCIKQFICGNTPLANVSTLHEDQVSRRSVLTYAASCWLEEMSGDSLDTPLLTQWLDADDVPSAYWFHGLRKCYKPLSVLAVAERTLITFTTQYMFAAKEAYKRLALGACGVGCGSAICWRVDKLNPSLTPHYLLNLKLYKKYCGIEDVVLGVEMARNFPDYLGYVSADCCSGECGQGLPVVYRNPSYKLGVDKRIERNKLLAEYRHERHTVIQGCDISGGYGNPTNL